VHVADLGAAGAIGADVIGSQDVSGGARAVDLDVEVGVAGDGVQHERVARGATQNADPDGAIGGGGRSRQVGADAIAYEVVAGGAGARDVHAIAAVVGNGVAGRR